MLPVMKQSEFTTRQDFGKRLFDLLFSALAMVMLSPVYLLIALVIKCTSIGPVFYSSLRVGQGGRAIHCYKFRTMCIDAEAKLQQLLEQDPVLKEEWDKYHKLKDDPRISRIGKWLRKTSLDELPQFWNVLKGDLSVVGPRPVTEEEVNKFFREKTVKILSVRPGLTGMWQTSGRNLLTFDERLAIEEIYVEKQSLLLDLAIIGKTVLQIFFAKGAF
jgi:exopolysaccharide production protein ExoY